MHDVKFVAANANHVTKYQVTFSDGVSANRQFDQVAMCDTIEAARDAAIAKLKAYFGEGLTNINQTPDEDFEGSEDWFVYSFDAGKAAAIITINGLPLTPKRVSQKEPYSHDKVMG